MRAEFTYDGGGLGKGAEITLFEDGKQLATGHIEATHPKLFSADETAEVQIDPGDDSHDHLITPEDRMRVAVGKQ
ncbi:hypothetical protein [Arthrobacter sp. UYCu712]|uniref:hypothetical protein n=1 Tax=Arthrobacter sp. UYCu712 TaxID=3156340 RepID=UPI0033949277